MLRGAAYPQLASRGAAGKIVGPMKMSPARAPSSARPAPLIFTIIGLALALAVWPPGRAAAQHADAPKVEKAAHVDPAPTYDPKAPVAWEEAEKAEAHFKKPVDLKVSVW